MSFTAGILNAYDWRNRGDRAIIEAQMAWIRRRIPGVRFKIFSNRWQENGDVFGSNVSACPPLHAPSGGGRISGVLKPLADWCRYAYGKSESFESDDFEACDGYFLCGGGYLYSSRAPVLSRQLWLHAGNSLLALRTGKPVMQFPQSWGPIQKAADRWICGKLAAHLPMIAARGEESARLAAALGGAERTLDLPDVVLAMRELRPDLFDLPLGHRGEGLGIAPIEYGFARRCTESDREAYVNKLADIAVEYDRRHGGGVHIYVQVSIPGHDDDAPMAQRVHQAITARGARAHFHNPDDWIAYWRHLSRRAVFLGCRMHSCIFGMVADVPVIGLAYQPKFRELFTQLGFPERCFDIGNFEVATTLTRIDEAIGQGTGIVRERVAKASSELLQGLDKCWNAACFPDPFDKPEADTLNPF